ncbi:HAD-IA family hydrolase [Candidatus Nomurabacteria bacterium]|nr:HAD-IA family hydrolase [Candidatus Kaiserbacteria bacterium]MCB9814812.1 HAD-IA family hydrolase [Candidatus Nomurabacteria bacterium]
MEAEKNRGELYEIYHKSSVNLISRDEMIDKMSNLLLCKPQELVKCVHNIYSEGSVENVSLYDFLEAISKSKLLKIGLLSTQFPLSKDMLVPKKYYDNFDSLGISCDSEIHLKKPEGAVFAKIIKELDTKPENVIFVDDQQKCVDAGNQLGINSVQFINNKQLAKDLVRFKVPGEIGPFLHFLD